MKILLFILILTPLSIFSQYDFDIVIKNGKVVDGTGNAWIYADVAILNGKIKAIGQFKEAKAKQIIDAKGLIVAPGFIDVHTHSEEGIFRVPTADNFIYDGVTSIITGNCGNSEEDLSIFFKKLNEKGMSVNLASLIGHNTVRKQVMGTALRDPSPKEQEKMEQLVKKAMQDGAVGLATGLIYIPGTYSKTPEIVGLAKVAAQYGGVYASHMRDEGSNVQEAIQEAVTIGREAKIPVEISHFKIAFKPFWGKSVETVEAVEKARREGIDINVDQYPYTASSTNLGVLAPSWALADGDSAIHARFTDAKTRAKIIAEMMNMVKKDNRTSYDYAFIARHRADSSYNGKNISEVNILRGGKPTLESEASTVLDLIDKGGAQMIYHKMSEEDIEVILRYPNTMIASDAGVQTFGYAVTHPRAYGTNARVLGRYVRERKVISLEDAIRRMTSLPAQRFNINDRGVLREGYAADVVIFDENKISDKATYEKPHAYSVGFQWVVVNGKIVVEKGVHNGTLSGHVLKGKGIKP